MEQCLWAVGWAVGLSVWLRFVSLDQQRLDQQRAGYLFRRCTFSSGGRSVDHQRMDNWSGCYVFGSGGRSADPSAVFFGLAAACCVFGPGGHRMV